MRLTSKTTVALWSAVALAMGVQGCHPAIALDEGQVVAVTFICKTPRPIVAAIKAWEATGKDEDADAVLNAAVKAQECGTLPGLVMTPVTEVMYQSKAVKGNDGDTFIGYAVKVRNAYSLSLELVN